jgi:hypothetical protein
MVVISAGDMIRTEIWFGRIERRETGLVRHRIKEERL